MIAVPQIIARTADSAARNSGNTGSTLTNDDTLLFAAGGNSEDVLFVEAFLIVSAANATMDVKVAWSVPAGVSGYHGPLNGVSNQGGWNSVNASTTPAALATALAGSFAYGTLVGTSGVYHGAQFFVGATAGTIALQWAQNTADAGDLKLLKGSFLRVTHLA